ncbi:LPXTG cell wall anchor domain-containing protein [Enterococcus faecalis]|uniref:LPXTG cell wall anchor domain-containing protein n=1 Tax=Enterococcus faecalis TaxID=1351 RepID=UPI0013E95017|nr:LPXTG cell wall anchor domain-containing protein [Enterococcus faecalis]
MMTMKSKGSLLVTLGILLTVRIAMLTFYGGKAPLRTKGGTKSTEQPVTNKDKKTSQQQDKVSRKTTAKTNPTNAQTSLPRTGERNSTWLYSLGIACLLVVLTSFYYLNKKRKKEK